MIDAERLDRAYLEAGGNCRPFHRLFGLRLEIDARHDRDIDISNVAMNSAKEGGEAVAALIAVGINLGCAVSLRNAKQQIEEAIAALTDGLAAVVAREVDPSA